MPPRGHSSSSHSSRSHSHSSSSHSSGSHSSRSHSSGSYSHSRSSHSGSSFAWSSFSPEANPQNRSPYVRNGSNKGKVIKRKKINQPKGYNAGEHSGRRMLSHYCLNHNYSYFPESWTDRKTGNYYQAGYYDEKGEYYQDVVFRRDGKYKDVLCECEYCRAKIHTDWKENTVLKCPNCGGQMKVISQLDEYTQDPNYTNDAAVRRKYSVKPTIVKCIVALCIFVLIILPTLLVLTMMVLVFNFIISDSKGSSGESGTRSSSGYEAPSDTNLSIYGDTLYLDDIGGGAYRIVTSEDDYEKKLKWDYGYDSYYDRESDCYLWYNTDVSPNLWQYWYENISSDYGDYGWMEYEPTGWYIEEDSSNWIALPDNYDTSGLWHIEIDESDFEDNVGSVSDATH